MREVWSEVSPQSQSASSASHLCRYKLRFEPCLLPWFIIPSLCPTLPHFATSAVLVVGKSFSLSLYQKLREFHWLSGSLLEAVGWICPSKEVFLSLALNKKRSQWSMSCSPLVLPTEAWRLPLQMGLEGTHTNWITWATQIASFLSQQLLYRTLQHHHEMML